MLMSDGRVFLMGEGGTGLMQMEIDQKDKSAVNPGEVLLQPFRVNEFGLAVPAFGKDHEKMANKDGFASLDLGWKWVMIGSFVEEKIEDENYGSWTEEKWHPAAVEFHDKEHNSEVTAFSTLSEDEFNEVIRKETERRYYYGYEEKASEYYTFDEAKKLRSALSLPDDEFWELVEQEQSRRQEAKYDNCRGSWRHAFGKLKAMGLVKNQAQFYPVTDASAHHFAYDNEGDVHHGTELEHQEYVKKHLDPNVPTRGNAMRFLFDPNHIDKAQDALDQNAENLANINKPTRGNALNMLFHTSSPAAQELGGHEYGKYPPSKTAWMKSAHSRLQKSALKIMESNAFRFSFKGKGKKGRVVVGKDVKYYEIKNDNDDLKSDDISLLTQEERRSRIYQSQKQARELIESIKQQNSENLKPSKQNLLDFIHSYQFMMDREERRPEETARRDRQKEMRKIEREIVQLMREFQQKGGSVGDVLDILDKYEHDPDFREDADPLENGEILKKLLESPDDERMKLEDEDLENQSLEILKEQHELCTEEIVKIESDLESIEEKIKSSRKSRAPQSELDDLYKEMDVVRETLDGLWESENRFQTLIEEKKHSVLKDAVSPKKSTISKRRQANRGQNNLYYPGAMDPVFKNVEQNFDVQNDFADEDSSNNKKSTYFGVLDESPYISSVLVDGSGRVLVTLTKLGSERVLDNKTMNLGGVIGDNESDTVPIYDHENIDSTNWGSGENPEITFRLTEEASIVARRRGVEDLYSEPHRAPFFGNNDNVESVDNARNNPELVSITLSERASQIVAVGGSIDLGVISKDYKNLPLSQNPNVSEIQESNNTRGDIRTKVILNDTVVYSIVT